MFNLTVKDLSIPNHIKAAETRKEQRPNFVALDVVIRSWRQTAIANGSPFGHVKGLYTNQPTSTNHFLGGKLFVDCPGSSRTIYISLVKVGDHVG